MNAAPGQFGRIALRGGLLTGGAQGIKIAVQFLSVVVLARLLAPEDFGLVASVGPVVAFVGLFQNLGLQQAVIQRSEISQRQLNHVFWVSALVGLCCSLAVAALAPAVAVFYGDARMTGITLAAAAPLLLGSLAALPLALMNRRLKFGQLALNDVVTAVAGLAATVAAALAGLGYWSLVIGPAVSALVALAAAWRVARWRPGKPSFRIDREILSFGANLTGFNLVNFFARNLDTILIGKFSGATELGYYDRAYKLMLFPLQNISQPLTRLMIPLMSRIQDDKQRFRSIYMDTNWLLAAVTAPGIAALTMTSSQVVSLLFGERWLAVAPIFAWLGIASLTQPISNTTGWIFICQGKTGTMFRWGVYSSAVAVAAFIVGMRWGAVGVAAAYAISGYILRIPVLAVLLHRVGPVTAGDFLIVQALFIAAALVSWGIFSSLPAQMTSGSDMVAVAVAIVLNYAVTLLLMLLLPQARKALANAFGRIAGGVR
ncbi:lipopolysaccharide biosynthesis protein [Mesorhizobium sp. L-8-3]|uniref:lipopolysaccharide biosynthesis protein n=1 Tax=Mesorhizobium sp. L-8-3 TaxID=2744522 RepID=UPI001925B55D|nr:lipopolysaccharide biosynthesis protein [Mesorhizobium sp. L-8-3]BCH23907.1 lipopolysaccharide biosynthesis protein [Mesorhizobium sp. L-8-3]